MTYEQAIRRIEEIAQLLEQGDPELAQSIALYEEGKKLMEFCDQQLKVAEQKVLTLDELLRQPQEDEQ